MRDNAAAARCQSDCSSTYLAMGAGWAGAVQGKLLCNLLALPKCGTAGPWTELDCAMWRHVRGVEG